MKTSARTRYEKMHRRYVIALFLLVAVCLLFAATRAQAVSTHAREDRVKCYTSVCVQEGDSLWSIAEAHFSEEYASTTELVEEIRRINHVGSDIRSGAYLMVPYYTASAQ